MNQNNSPQFHLAQLNVARLLYPLNSPEVAEFREGLAPVNELAERSPGFVWRLQDETGNATGYHAFDDFMIIINLSVWENLESLHRFAFHGEHAAYLRQRFQWFEKMKEAYSVLWWVPAGHTPHVAEAVARLKFLRKYGETPKAFTFKKTFEP